MRSQARVVVIGGGVVGASVLYHLTKRGWKDVVLIERDELTSGSTWHAAGGFHTLNGDPNVAKLQEYTINLYKEIEQISGQATGVHLTGGVMLVSNRDRWDWLKMAHARNRYLGVPTELIPVKEAKKRWPLLDEKQFIGAMWHPLEGHLDPSGTTHAYAKAARMQGARSHPQEPRHRHGAAHGRHAGMSSPSRARSMPSMWSMPAACGRARSGRFVGLELPILAMAHQYLITEEIPEVVAFNKETGREMLHCIDFDGELYMRQERTGALVGTYEPNGGRGRRKWRRGISRPSSCRPISIISPTISSAPSSIIRRSPRPASRMSSTDPSPSHPTAIHWSGRSGACTITGSPAA